MNDPALTDKPTVRTLTCARVPVAVCTRHEAARYVIDLAKSAQRRQEPTARPGVDVHLCNAYTLALADRDSTLRGILTEAGVNFPDGKSVVWANHVLHRGQNVPTNRVYGPDLFLDVLDGGQDAGLRHYLLGGSPPVLAALRAEIERRFPRAEVVGAESPPFRELNDEELAAQDARIRNSGAQLVWVGLGTPKQDLECARLAATVPAVHLAVGAAFDFVAGAKKQAPVWMRERGLEWLFRLISEPRRLWRRYLFGNTRFLWAVVRNTK
jgi:N-acetylglucosaminyldiphosphoundecaprenol N-acetyl-beta-D-mannosaminyltransferase